MTPAEREVIDAAVGCTAEQRASGLQDDLGRDEARVRELERWATPVMDRVSAAEKRAAEAEAERKPLVEALRLAEWGAEYPDDDGRTQRCCPVCGFSETEGHGNSCEMRAALSAIEGSK